MFAQIMMGLATKHSEKKTVMIDATYLKTHRTKPVRYDKRRYKRRNRIKIMFGWLKNWQRATIAVPRSFSVQSLAPQPPYNG